LDSENESPRLRLLKRTLEPLPQRAKVRSTIEALGELAQPAKEEDEVMDQT